MEIDSEEEELVKTREDIRRVESVKAKKDEEKEEVIGDVGIPPKRTVESREGREKSQEGGRTNDQNRITR